MKLRFSRSKLCVLLPCIGAVAFCVLPASADPQERTGSDAPHHERNQSQNERKTALSLTEVNVPAFSGTQKPVRRATAVKTASTSRSKKDKKKAEQAAKEKARTEAIAAETVQEKPRYDSPQDDIIGSDAPHQERGSNPNARAARLFILDR